MNSYGKERRKFPRAVFPCKLTVCAPKERIISTYTENIGCGGLQLKLKEKLKVSTVAVLEICIDNNTTVKCRARIVWRLADKCEASNEELFFDIGLEFVDISRKDMIVIENLVEKLSEQESC